MRAAQQVETSGAATPRQPSDQEKAISQSAIEHVDTGALRRQLRSIHSPDDLRSSILQARATISDAFMRAIAAEQGYLPDGQQPELRAQATWRFEGDDTPPSWGDTLVANAYADMVGLSPSDAANLPSMPEIAQEGGLGDAAADIFWREIAFKLKDELDPGPGGRFKFLQAEGALNFMPMPHYYWQITGHLVHGIRAKDARGLWAYYHILVPPEREPAFFDAINGNGMIEMDDYGTLLASMYATQFRQLCTAAVEKKIDNLLGEYERLYAARSKLHALASLPPQQKLFARRLQSALQGPGARQRLIRDIEMRGVNTASVTPNAEGEGVLGLWESYPASLVRFERDATARFAALIDTFACDLAEVDYLLRAMTIETGELLSSAQQLAAIPYRDGLSISVLDSLALIETAADLDARPLNAETRRMALALLAAQHVVDRKLISEAVQPATLALTLQAALAGLWTHSSGQLSEDMIAKQDALPPLAFGRKVIETLIFAFTIPGCDEAIRPILLAFLQKYEKMPSLLTVFEGFITEGNTAFLHRLIERSLQPVFDHLEIPKNQRASVAQRVSDVLTEPYREATQDKPVLGEHTAKVVIGALPAKPPTEKLWSKRANKNIEQYTPEDHVRDQYADRLGPGVPPEARVTRSWLAKDRGFYQALLKWEKAGNALSPELDLAPQIAPTDEEIDAFDAGDRPTDTSEYWRLRSASQRRKSADKTI